MGKAVRTEVSQNREWSCHPTCCVVAGWIGVDRWTLSHPIGATGGVRNTLRRHVGLGRRNRWYGCDRSCGISCVSRRWRWSWLFLIFVYFRQTESASVSIVILLFLFFVDWKSLQPPETDSLLYPAEYSVKAYFARKPLCPFDRTCLLTFGHLLSIILSFTLLVCNFGVLLHIFSAR